MRDGKKKRVNNKILKIHDINYIKKSQNKLIISKKKYQE